MEVQVCLRPELVRETVELPAAERLVVESGISFHQSQAEMAQLASFKTQADLHRRKADEFQIRLLPTPPFPEVSEVEYYIWNLFLPRSYPRREWAGYRFDLVPPDVLEVVRVHGHLFDEMEIRTPEVQKSDPVIFGHRGGKKYLVARWAESRLIPFAEVADTVLGRMENIDPFVCGSIFAAVCLGIMGWGISIGDAAAIAVFSGFGTVFFLFSVVFFWKAFEQRSEKKKLIRKLAALPAQPVSG